MIIQTSHWISSTSFFAGLTPMLAHYILGCQLTRSVGFSLPLEPDLCYMAGLIKLDLEVASWTTDRRSGNIQIHEWSEPMMPLDYSSGRLNFIKPIMWSAAIFLQVVTSSSLVQYSTIYVSLTCNVTCHLTTYHVKLFNRTCIIA
jgi:hypothetical protein